MRNLGNESERISRYGSRKLIINNLGNDFVKSKSIYVKCKFDYYVTFIYYLLFIK